MSKKRSFAFYFLISAVIVVLLGLTAFSYLIAYKKSQYKMPVMVSQVSAIEITTANYIGALNSSGFVSSNDTGSLAVLTGGRVAKINIKPGQEVKKGQVILSLDTTAEQAALNSARAQLNALRLRYEGLKSTYAQGGASKYDLDAAQGAYVAQVQSAKSAEQAVENKQIISPFDGVVGSITPAIGDIVTAGTVIVTVVPNSEESKNNFFINISVSPNLLSNVSYGNQATAYDDNNNLLATGTVEAVDSTISTSTGLSQARVVFSADANLHKGQFVTVKVATNTVSNQITVPAVAVNYSLYGPMVYRLDPLTEKDKETLGDNTNGVYRVTQVYITANDNVNGISLVTKGLNVGDYVITNYNNIADGSFVRIAKGYGIGVPTSFKLPTEAVESSTNSESNNQ